MKYIVVAIKGNTTKYRSFDRSTCDAKKRAEKLAESLQHDQGLGLINRAYAYRLDGDVRERNFFDTAYHWEKEEGVYVLYCGTDRTSRRMEIFTNKFGETKARMYEAA